MKLIGIWLWRIWWNINVWNAEARIQESEAGHRFNVTLHPDLLLFLFLLLLFVKFHQHFYKGLCMCVVKWKRCVCQVWGVVGFPRVGGGVWLMMVKMSVLAGQGRDTQREKLVRWLCRDVFFFLPSTDPRSSDFKVELDKWWNFSSPAFGPARAEMTHFQRREWGT